ISVAANGENAAVVSIRSGAKTILGSATTHGKNRKNVREIIAQTSMVLKEQGAKWSEELRAKQPIFEGGKSPTSVVDEISKLAALMERGAITKDEFDALKTKLMNG